MTVSNIRLRELQREHEDRASQLGLSYVEIQQARDTAAALEELHIFRVKLVEMMRPGSNPPPTFDKPSPPPNPPQVPK